MGSFSKFRLRWNNHLSNFVGSLGSLLKSENYSDVTVYCEGHVWQLHRLVLSASSNHFDQLLNSIPIGLTPGIILDGPSANDVEAIIQFIYHGEVSIHQDLLPSLLRTASSLKIKGLADVSLVDTEASLDEHSSTLNYNQNQTDKVERMCLVGQEDPDKPVTTLSEIYELSPLNLSRHQSAVHNKMEARPDDHMLKGMHKRFAYFENDDYPRENSYGYAQTHYHVAERSRVSPPFKKLRSANMAQSDQHMALRQIDAHDKAHRNTDQIPYDLSTSSCEKEKSSIFHTKMEIKEEDNQDTGNVGFDSKHPDRIVHISSSNLSHSATGRCPYPINKDPEMVHLVCEDPPCEVPAVTKPTPDQKPENGNYVHLKKRITNMEKHNSSSAKVTMDTVSETPEPKSTNDTDSSKSLTYSDASVGPSDEVTETFNHKKFSHCTILSSGDAIHVVRGVYNPNLLNGSSYKILNPKSKVINESFTDNTSVKKTGQHSLSTATFPSAVNPSPEVVPVKQENTNGNSSILLVSSTSQNIGSPVSADMASPGSKSDDKSTGEGSDNDAFGEGSTLHHTGGGAETGGQGSQRVTINMRTFKEEWRRQLLVDYDPRTNMSICMLCFTTFKSYDGPRKNTYVKHAKRFHPALDEYSDEEREVIINMYEKYHKYDIDMQKEINKSFRTPNGPGCISKRSGKIIDASSYLNGVQNTSKVASQEKDSSPSCDWTEKISCKSAAESESDEANSNNHIKENVTIKPVINSNAELQFSNVSASNFNSEQNLCSADEEPPNTGTRRKSG